MWDKHLSDSPSFPNSPMNEAVNLVPAHWPFTSAVLVTTLYAL